MSRSRKKVGAVKLDEQTTREQANRAFRRINKVRLQQEKDLLLPEEVTNPCSICDYKYVDFKDEYPEYKRK